MPILGLTLGRQTLGRFQRKYTAPHIKAVGRGLDAQPLTGNPAGRDVNVRWRVFAAYQLVPPPTLAQKAACASGVGLLVGQPWGLGQPAGAPKDGTLWLAGLA